MGGLASVRKNFQQEGVVPSFQFDPYGGRTTGDVTGGGGRSVMPNRDFLRRILPPGGEGIQGPGPMARRRPTGGGYGGITLVPPGGGYSGGVIPRFQTGGLTSGPPQAPSPPNPSNFRTGFEMNPNMPWMPQSWRDRQSGFRYSVAGHSLPKYLQHHFKTRSGPNVTDILKEQPAWWPESARGWRAWQIPRPGIEGHSVGVAPTGTRNLSGSRGRGGYSGGVVPRFQGGGRTVDPRYAAVEARRRNRPIRPQIQIGRASVPSNLPPWPGTPSPVVTPGVVPPAGYIPPPGGGYSGGVVPSFQEGGQLEEPLFPVESELADESPWYPDEDVGYEAAAPMQGGFDIFGRAGG